MSYSPLITPADRVIENNRSNQTSAAALKFPSDISTHGVVFMFRNYQYEGGKINNAVTNSSVVLPLPRSLTDVTGIGLRPFELGQEGAAAADAAQFLIGEKSISANQLKQLGKDAVQGASGLDLSNVQAFAKWAAQYATKYIAPSIDTAIGITGKGTALNPHTTLAFSGVDLKNHTFDWTLAPKNEIESDMIKEIIKHFRKNALPSYVSPFGTNTTTGTSFDRALFNYPHIVDTFLIGVDSEYFIKYKPCMVTGIQVDYASQGQALLKGTNGSRPAVVTLTITMTEMYIHTQEDYVESNQENRR